MSRHLITADWHIRSTVPGCIEATPEEWMEFQKKSIHRVLEIAKENKVGEIDVGGDLYHSERTATNECTYILQDAAQEADEQGTPMYIFAGNHDLINHSSSNISRSSIGVLLNSQGIHNMAKGDSFIKACNFDEDDYGEERLIFRHVLTIPAEDKPDFIECETPESLLKKYPDADWIFTGDYHRNFEYSHCHRHVINPGCLMRQASDFEDYVPGVYIVDTEKEEITFEPIGLEQKFNHNGQEKKMLDQSIENFVEGIRKENITLDYVSSLKNEIQNHDKGIQDKINDWIERSGN